MFCARGEHALGSGHGVAARGGSLAAVAAAHVEHIACARQYGHQRERHADQHPVDIVPANRMHPAMACFQRRRAPARVDRHSAPRIGAAAAALGLKGRGRLAARDMPHLLHRQGGQVVVAVFFGAVGPEGSVGAVALTLP